MEEKDTEWQTNEQALELTLNVSCLCNNLIYQEFGIHILNLFSKEKMTLKSYQLQCGELVITSLITKAPSNATEEAYIT